MVVVGLVIVGAIIIDIAAPSLILLGVGIALIALGTAGMAYTYNKYSQDIRSSVPTFLIE
jgi:hypothetical protein